MIRLTTLVALLLLCAPRFMPPLQAQSFGACGIDICASPSGAAVGIGGVANINPNGRSMLSVSTGMGFDGPSPAVTQYFSVGGTGSLTNAENSSMIWTRNYDNVDIMALTGSGWLGVGTGAPNTPLHVQEAGSSNLDWIGMLNNPANGTGTGYGVGLRLQNSTPSSGGNEQYKWAGVAAVAGSSYSNQTDMAFYTNNFSGNATSAPTERMRIQGVTGNVGIGTINPQYPLAVNGIIQAKEVLVNTGWSDYVFDPAYRLAPLTEVDAYVQQHHHLPDMPSSDEVAAKGIGIGAIESKLLAKIEELTLHMIQAEKENRELKERLNNLEKAAQR